MEVLLAARQLLTRLFEAAKAYLDLHGSRDQINCHPEARKHRPKHLKVKQ